MSAPDWIKTAERVALTHRAETARQHGAGHSVYVILLRDPRRAGRWGLYVGQTARDPDLRFDQHKAGHKASKAVKRFGRVEGYAGSPQHSPPRHCSTRGSSRDSIRPVPVTRAPEADRPAVASAGERVAERRLNRVGLEVSAVNVAARPVRL